MDVLNLTNSKRRELVEWAAKILCKESLHWFRSTLSAMNKQVLNQEREDFIEGEYVAFYTNFKRFFDECVDVMHPGYVLYSLFSCAVQLNILSLDDSVVSLPEFCEVIDVEDFKNVTLETLCRVDYHTHLSLFTKEVIGNSIEIKTCGIATLVNMKYYDRIKGE